MPPLPQLAPLIAVLLPAGKIVASLCSRVGIPPIIGELLVGIVAGRGVLNLHHLRLFSGTSGSSAFMLLAQVGAVVLMFIAGFEIDIDRMKEGGVTAFLVALSGVIWPFMLGTAAGHLFGLSWNVSLFLGGALTCHQRLHLGSHPHGCRTHGSLEASVILGAAVIDDVMGLFVLAFLTAFSASSAIESFGAAPALSTWLDHRSAFAAQHSLLVQMIFISLSVALFFMLG